MRASPASIAFRFTRRPHPDLLPAGEGTRLRLCEFTYIRSLNSVCPATWNYLDLPIREFASHSGEWNSMDSGTRNDDSAPSTGSLDLQVLEAILHATESEQSREPLPADLRKLVDENRNVEPDEQLVGRLVTAALSTFWSPAFSTAHREAICRGVAQRLSDDPGAMDRIRRLLKTGTGEN